MNKKRIFVLTLLSAFMFFVVGCASTKMEAKGKESKIIDWSNRSLDAEAKPLWLVKLLNGNTSVFKKEFEVDNSYVIKYSIASGKTRDLSMAASRVNYNAVRAEELRTKVVSEAAATLNDEGSTDAIANAATLAKVDLSGHELVKQFWHEISTYDKETETEKKEFICYSIYKISKEDWKNTLKNYMKSVLPVLPDSDSKKKMAATINSLYQDTTVDNEKTSEETLSEINKKIDAIQNSSKTVEYPVPQSSDIEWMKILEVACELIL